MIPSMALWKKFKTCRTFSLAAKDPAKENRYEAN